MPKYASKHRSTEVEIMDDFNLQGKEMQAVLTDLKTVSNLLGGANITLKGIKKLLSKRLKNEEVTIIDVGCGDGEMLRKCAHFGKRNQYNFNLIGLDANPNIISEAKERSKSFENLTFKTLDIFSAEPFPKADIILCNLFLHHFKNADIVSILKKLIEASNMGVVVNDLHRSKLAFTLFKGFSSVFLKTKIARHDGLVSVARGFKREELDTFSEEINNQQSLIRWKWAFRYQWILKNNL
ncbi:methyltransferase domain-containing protein [Marixanthomonas ophiurae]|uniref:Methyltransferase domain-containing protein n=1 Tax=Marixanthomonas ophiurae TaxID=387659 RepID=A0A3E1Q7K7_9FLAO|nr:methyltransferase domain-containing protein [Marixanthomonas ophiurae]RFN58123.1 methyltransferase domain-containing protein [Marixanthomonas ophiurae]